MSMKKYTAKVVFKYNFMYKILVIACSKIVIIQMCDMPTHPFSIHCAFE